MAERDGVLSTLERRSPTLYLIAAVVMIVFLVNSALRTYQGTSYPAIQQFIAPAGFLIGLVGLMGLYRPLSDRARRLAQVSLAVAVLSALNWTAIVAAGLLETAGSIPENATFQAITGVLALFSMVFAYGLFGVTSMQTGAYRRVISGFLLLEAVTFVAMVANSAASLGAPVLIFEASHFVAYLGLGIAHRGVDTQADRADPTADPTV
ncbi:hypothetical protein [Natrinema halophilum]|uniref:Uncharacterized protein n=1 Tax=Natrinema halophilum TaxID=1699371 RepID=A0A7D5GS62_9EURY|nr:hypothetical protein [Natrinema halophilum]QLG49029.1 hypothetical protein HYG82_09305 [Natrinema halophilum]